MIASQKNAGGKRISNNRPIEGINITPLSLLPAEGGEVWHAMKSSEPDFKGFGETYFSWIESGMIKGWKRHREMTMNVIVPVGLVKFVFFDSVGHLFQEVIIGVDHYSRICVPPGLWFGFQGLTDSASLVMNIADMTHDPNEVERKAIDLISYGWSKI